MRRAIHSLTALAAAAALVGGVALTRSAPVSDEAYWVCVYVDHVHLLACQDKPIDFYPDDDDEAKGQTSRGAAAVAAATSQP
jgi:hypothetical protein